MSLPQEQFNSPLKTADAFLPFYPMLELPPAAATMPLTRERSWEPVTPMPPRNTSLQTEVRDASVLTQQLNSAVENMMQNDEVRNAKRQKREDTQLAEFQSTVQQLDLRVRLAMMDSLYQLSRLSQPHSSPSHRYTPSWQLMETVQKLLAPPSTAASSAVSTFAPVTTTSTLNVPSKVEEKPSNTSTLPASQPEQRKNASPQLIYSPSTLTKTRMLDMSTPSPTANQRTELSLKHSNLFATPPPESFVEPSVVSPTPFFMPSQKRPFTSTMELDFSVW